MELAAGFLIEIRLAQQCAWIMVGAVDALQTFKAIVRLDLRPFTH